MVELLLIPAIGYEVLTWPLASSCSIRPQAVVCHESATALGAGHRLWSSDSAIGYGLLIRPQAAWEGIGLTCPWR